MPIKVAVESIVSTAIDLDEVKLQNPPIGEGSFGVVYRGEW